MFRVKDLVISVVPKTSELAELRKCLLGTHICIRPTIVCPRLTCAFLTPCPFLHTPCGPLSPCNIFSPCGHLSPCGPYSPCGAFSPCGHLSPCGQLSPCGFVSPCGHLSPCPLHSVACEFGTRPGCPGASVFENETLTPVINPAVRVINEVADIKALRQELDEVQKQLAEFEQKGLDVAAESAEDLAALETKLQEALEDVRARRKSGGNSKK